MFDDDELPAEARAIHQRLMRDSSHWERQLPAETRVAEFARTTPQRIPAPTAQRHILTHRRLTSARPDMMNSKGQMSMFKPQRPGRTLVASLAAIAVVALIGGLLYAVHGAHGPTLGPAGGPATHTASAPTSTPSPQDAYSATPGPLAQYVSKLYTTAEYPTDNASVDVTSHFVVGAQVYLSMIVHDLPEGEHTISVNWYLDGSSIAGPSSVSRASLNNTRIVVSLTVSQPGIYKAKVYIDLPTNDTGDSSSDPHLVGTVFFAVTAS